MCDVRAMRLNGLIRDERGISSVEFVIVVILFFMLCFGVIDFARAMGEWNAAAKATQRGARFAVVNDVVAQQIDDIKTDPAFDVFNPGDTIPAGTPKTGPFRCTLTTGCNNVLGKINVAAFTAIVTAMQARYDRIQPQNVVITYEHAGLGFYGSPIGPWIDPLVTIELQNMQFEFITPGLNGILTIDIPPFPTSLTAEDHRT